GQARAVGHAARLQGGLRPLLRAGPRPGPPGDQGVVHPERAHRAARGGRQLHRALHVRVPRGGPQRQGEADAGREASGGQAGGAIRRRPRGEAVGPRDRRDLAPAPRRGDRRTGPRSRPEETSMKAIRVHTPGGPEALTYDDVAEPTPGPGQAAVKLAASGVNYIDVYFRTGAYKAPLPITVGLEGAGTVSAVGSGVSEVKVGDRVAWTGVPGSYAQVTIAPADRLVKLPDAISFKDGAAAMLQGLTAHYLVTSTYPLKNGDACLVQAAAGGMGLLLCQMAKMRGATVIGTVSTEEKAALAKAAGADHVILYTKQDFEPEVKRVTGGAGVHVV